MPPVRPVLLVLVTLCACSSASNSAPDASVADAESPPLVSPQFTDATATLPAPSQLGFTMEARAADYDGDGDIDLFIAKERKLNALYLNDGSGHFVDASERIPKLIHDHEDIAVADFDLDGDLDIAVACEDDSAKELYLNDGHGNFTDESSRLLQMCHSDSVLAADLDRDGDPDLLFGCGGSELLLINDGTGHFTDESATRLPVTNDITQDVAAADIDGDGDLDVVLGNEDGNKLFLNDGTGHFTDVTATQLPLPAEAEETRNADFGDVDGDGDVDLYFSNVAFRMNRNPQDRLLINDGRGFFTDETSTRIPAEQRWTMDSDLIDLDGDGDLDLVQAFVPGASRYRVLINDGRGTFTDQTDTVFSADIVGDGVEVEAADFNGDGKPDLYLTGYRSEDLLLLSK